MARILFVLSLLLSLGTSMLQAQNLTLNPYSRFGIGEIFPNTTARNMAMGEVSQATYNYASVNRLNPAAYADLLYTVVDFSGFSKQSWLRTRNDEEKQFSAGFQNLMFGFPTNKSLVLTFGFAPFSSVGYDISTQYTIRIDDTTQTGLANYTAEGGLNQGFIGLATTLFQRKLRLGVNGYFTFGNLRYRWQSAVLNQSLSDYSDVQIEEATYVSGGGLHGGFIFSDTLSGKIPPGKKQPQGPVTILRLGGSVDYSFDLNGDRLITYDNRQVLDTLSDGLELGAVVIPAKLGFGASIVRPGHWELSAEATMRDWTQFQYFSDSINLSRGLRVAVGGEWIPKISGDSYFQRIAYRAGFYRDQTYLTVAGNPIIDMGFSIGFGLPSSRRGTNIFNRERAYSQLSLGFAFGKRGSLKDGHALEETYFKARVGITINERWFRKVQID